MKKERVQYYIGLGIIIFAIAILKIFVWTKIAENYSYFESQTKMFLSIVLLRYFLLFIYDLVKIDCFKIERKKAGKEYEENSITRKIDKAKKSGRVGIFFLISSLEPTIGIIHFRPGSFKWNGLPGLETKILFISGNLWTMILWGTIIELIF